MQRPCFALAVLLGSMASSGLVVGTVHSQPRVNAANALPAPSSICRPMTGGPTASVVLGQSIDAGDDAWWEDAGGADYVASDDAQQRDADASLATDETVTETQTSSCDVPGTGYDAAYDFAMHDGRYLDVAPSRTDIENSWAAERSDAAQEHNRFVFNGPASSMSCEDYHCYEDRALQTDTTGSWPCGWCGQDLTTIEDCENGWDVCGEEGLAREALHESCAVWFVRQMIEVSNWAQATVGDWYAEANQQTWVMELREHYDSMLQGEKTEFLASASRWCEYVTEHELAIRLRGYWAVALSQPSQSEDIPVSAPALAQNVAVDFHEEVLLLATADRLDQLGIRLQHAARQLRFWASDRIVSKVNSRRVAQRPQ